MNFYQFASDSPVLTFFLALIASSCVVGTAKKLARFRPVKVVRKCDCSQKGEGA